MREYGVYEAKTKLADLIKQVQQGEHITITNRGKPVVDLVLSTNHAEQQVAEAIDAIKMMKFGNIDQQQFSTMRLKGRR